MTSDFRPKYTGAGDFKWTGFYTTGTSKGGTTYVLEGEGSRRLNFIDSKGIVEVRAQVNAAGKPVAWDIVLYGDVIETKSHKVDAQQIVQDLFGYQN